MAGTDDRPIPDRVLPERPETKPLERFWPYTDVSEQPTEEEMAALRLRFDASRTVVQSSRLFTTIPASGRLIEGIAWDGRRDRLFASSVVGRELIYGDGENWRTVPGLDAGSLFGLAIDDPRRLLWIASGAVDQTPSPETAFRGLIALDLDRLQVIDCSM